METELARFEWGGVEHTPEFKMFRKELKCNVGASDEEIHKAMWKGRRRTVKPAPARNQRSGKNVKTQRGKDQRGKDQRGSQKGQAQKGQAKKGQGESRIPGSTVKEVEPKPRSRSKNVKSKNKSKQSKGKGKQGERPAGPVISAPPAASVARGGPRTPKDVLTGPVPKIKVRQRPAEATGKHERQGKPRRKPSGNKDGAVQDGAAGTHPKKKRQPKGKPEAKPEARSGPGPN